MLSSKVTRKQLIKKYPDKLDAVNRQFLPAAGVMIQKEAKRNLRANGTVDSNRLRGSIQYDVGKDEVTIGTNVEYAIYVEYGTGKYAESGQGRKTPWVYFNEKLKKFFWTEGMRAQPYLRPALDINRKNLVRMWKDIFRSVYGR